MTVPAVFGARLKVPGEAENIELLEVMLLMDSVALPVLVMLRKSWLDDPTAMLSNDSEVEDSERTGPVPVPDRETVDGLPAALWEMDSVPDLAPVVVGAKVTVTVPEAPAARLRIVGESVNMALLEVMPPTESVPVPVLVIVSV